jgi:hypothetical protein
LPCLEALLDQSPMKREGGRRQFAGSGSAMGEREANGRSGRGVVDSSSATRVDEIVIVLMGQSIVD